MKKHNMDDKKVRKILSNLEKASIIFDRLGMWIVELDILEEDDENEFIEAVMLLGNGMRKLREATEYQSNTK